MYTVYNKSGEKIKITSKNIVTSFSYSTDKADLVTSIEKQAQKEGKSLSKKIVECLEDYIQKNGIVEVNPTNIHYQNPSIKTIEDYLNELVKLEEFLVDDNRTHEEITRIQAKIIAVNKRASQQFYVAKDREREKLRIDIK